MAATDLDLPGLTGELGAELAAALELARSAGVEVMKWRGGDLGVEMKTGNEPVTIADKRASEIIVDGLRARFPHDPVVSEEEPTVDGILGAPRVWLVDPIDGTKDFIRGSDGFSVMIGIARLGKPVLGVVHQPAVDPTGLRPAPPARPAGSPPLGRTFFATPDGGAHVLIGDKLAPLVVSTVASAADARLVASASHRSPDIDRVKQTLGIDNEQNIGSIGVKLCLIALGVRDLYVNPQARTKVWDTCGPEAILAGAGGRLSDLFGDPVNYGELRQPRGLVASNGHVHDEVVAKLAPLFEPLRRK